MTDLHTYAELLAHYEQERADPEWQPVRLGFGSIDTEIRGVSPGQVLGIAARTAVGKSFLLETVEQNFVASGHGQVTLSLEMPGGEWAERALAIHEDVPPEQVEAWARQRELAEHAAAFLERMRCSLVVESAVRLEQLPAVVGEARDRLAPVPVRLLLVDYLGLLGTDGRDAYERASKLGRGLKAVAKAANVAVVVAMQVSRAGGSGGEPVTLEMLRDSGVLEESLDFLLGCWRPGLALAKRQDMTSVELEEADAVMTVAVLKNRKGKQGRWVDLRFRPGSRRLYEPGDPFAVSRETA